MKIEKNITICFDTNIYDDTKYFFNGHFYTTFKKLKKSYPNLRIYVEPIIYNEVLAHLRDRAVNTAQDIEKILKNIKNLDIFTNAKETLEIEDIENKCFLETKGKFEEFIKFFSDEEIEENFNYEISEILVDYFQGSPPFENKKSKKSEFPDALIIQRLKNKFQSHENLIIVSSDKGFIDAIKNKIPNSRTFKNYPDCADFLNKQQEKYAEAHRNVENLVDSIKEVITKQFDILLHNFVPLEYAESLGIEIDATNYDRKDYPEFSDLDEVMINNLDLNSYSIRILDIDSDEGRVSAEITFLISMEIHGYEDVSYDLILETHQISYTTNVEVSLDSNEIIDISNEAMILNKASLINRSIERDFFVYDYDYDYDYVPSLHPINDSYSVVCDSCEFRNEFFSPEIDEFDSSSCERGMGDETLYNLIINENCQECDQSFTLEIFISIYPYLTLNDQEISCSGGETDLSFDLS